jgi:hypothetical protein
MLIWQRWVRRHLCGASRVTAQAVEKPADRGLAEKVVATERYADARWSSRDWFEYLIRGRRPEPKPSYTGLVEAPQQGRIGIASSGGGIRSAAFSLGALQVLQELKVLQKSSYLAAVSGGSYIAAAFTMVRKVWNGVERPDDGEPGWDDSDPAAVNASNPPFFPGSPEEQYLRNRSSYLAPGALGKLRLGYRFVLGLGINMGFIALFLITVGVGLGLAYGGLYDSLAKHVVGGECGHQQLCHFTPLVIRPVVYLPIVSLAVLAVVMGGASMVAYRWAQVLQEVAEVWSVRLLIAAIVAAVLLIGIPVLLSLFRAWGTISNPSIGLKPSVHGGQAIAQVVGLSAGGAVTAGTAIVLQLRSDWMEAKRVAGEIGKAAAWYSKLSRRLRIGLAYTAAAALGPILALALVILTTSITLNLAHPDIRWIIFGSAAALFAVIYSVADLTTWSLHPFYRRRLCSAFALKRVTRPPGSPPIARDESGIAEERNPEHLVRLSESAIVATHGEPTADWPTLLVCAAANVSDSAATPPGRSVTSFTFSANAIGGPLVGAVPTADLQDSCDERRNWYFTLPAAVAMSGAALSPSMGKMTRRPLRFLMTLANIRLGVWVPNPRRIETFRRAKDTRRVFPRPRPSYLVRELFGINHLNAPFLYVTDGGHYENLGLVELLRRGCTEIYCFDASNDNFDALGDAISLARSELQVEIQMESTSKLKPSKAGVAETDCLVGTIAYPGSAASGRLYYARCVMTREVPEDVVAYQAHDPRFPHDSTVDQLYLDQRFEAYRALGKCAGEHALQRAGRMMNPSDRPSWATRAPAVSGQSAST